jgi:predicted transposase YbfD/YdcC
VKTIRGSHDKKLEKSAIHLVSAWCHKEGMLIGQKKVDNKSNEITAIPELLKTLDIKGSVVSIDAMGCQKNIADRIIEQKGDYILALKGNHKNMLEEIEKFFQRHKKYNFQGKGYDFLRHSEVDKGHGRIEARTITLIQGVAWLPDFECWSGLKSLVMLESERIAGDKTGTETRYYISSLQSDAKKMLELIRSHWSIENSLHWVLDVVFQEDRCRVRQRNADHNLATLRKLSLNLIKKAKKPKNSIKGTRKLAGWHTPRH